MMEIKILCNLFFCYIVKSPKQDDDGGLQGKQFEKFKELQKCIRREGEGSYEDELKKEVSE